MRRRKLLEFLSREPLIAGALQDLSVEARRNLTSISAEMVAIRSEVHSIWEGNKARLQKKLKGVEDERLFVYGRLEDGNSNSYENRLTCSLTIDYFASDDDDILMNSIVGLEQFAKWKEEDRNILTQIQSLRRRAARNTRELTLFRRSDPWIAFKRLSQECQEFNAEIVSDGTVAEFSSLESEKRTAKVIESERLETTYVGQIQEVCDTNEELLQEALILQVGLLRSRYSLISRFAVRCEAFDAERLRAIADTKAPGKKIGKPEALLTLRFARYLFDSGIRPLMDPTIGGLRPDIFDPTSGPTLYVEAKQYSGSNPGPQIKRNYTQVWSTWARMRKVYSCDEAFLVVFRRAGPLVDLPKVIRHEDLRLYSVVVDISDQGGSKEKHKIISLREDELRPQSYRPVK